MKKTYINESLQQKKLIRWPDNAMPLSFYIAPFRFYSAKHEDYKYRQMVIDAMKMWESVSGGLVRFIPANTLNESQINLEWKRVERKSLGHCNFHFDNIGRLYSAEIQIGISDGIIHAKYMDENEVYHTILHEIGHSLGLGHSPNTADIMYTPHQYGNTRISETDKQTLKWFYKFPCGKSSDEIANHYSSHIKDLDELVYKLTHNKKSSEFERVKNEIVNPQKDLLDEQTRIAELKKYNMELQKIELSDNLRKFMINPNKD